MTDEIEKVFMDPLAIDRIRRLIHQHLGILIKDGKESLLRQRLWKLIQGGEFKDLNDICDQIDRSTDSKLILRLATLVSTNHTYFFRESAHFAFLINTVLPSVKTDKGKIRVWSAASSSGEEAYTLCMVLADYYGFENFKRDVAILGTDISQKVLQQAELGVYPKDILDQIPATMRLNYTKPYGKLQFQVSEGLRSTCLFRRLNLTARNYPFKNKFHVIFCRNVFIYFDLQTQEIICKEFAKISMPDAWLFISQTETLRNLSVPWQYVRPGIYKKVENYV